jgi:hypothetical protein
VFLRSGNTREDGMPNIESAATQLESGTGCSAELLLGHDKMSKADYRYLLGAVLQANQEHQKADQYVPKLTLVEGTFPDGKEWIGIKNELSKSIDMWRIYGSPQASGPSEEDEIDQQCKLTRVERKGPSRLVPLGPS